MENINDSLNDIIANLSDKDIDNLKNMAQNIFGGESGEPPKEESTSSDLPNINLAQIGQIMNTMKGEDDRTRLIKALKPMLSPSKQRKADEAVRMLRLFRILPLIRDSGLLKGFLEDNG